MNGSHLRACAFLLFTAAPSACASGGPSPAAGPAAVDAAERTDTARDANVRFMHDMIAHHGQALEMTALAEERASDPDVRRLALRIETAQQDEIARMRRWLASQGEQAPAAHAHHGGHRMPGMLSEEEMAALAEATGEAFDRLFIESMIRHHEGALVMVADLLSGGGGMNDVEVFQLASHIDADQRAEIARMRRMLEQRR